MNYSNKGEEFPETTKGFLPPVPCGSTQGLTHSIKGPDPNCQVNFPNADTVIEKSMLFLD